MGKVFGLISLLCFGFLSLTGESSVADVSSVNAEKIVALARDGKDVEAIVIFEKLQEGSDVSLVVMRSVAGCYWRERQFDKSRALYQQILDRRPTLHSMSDNPQAKSSVADVPADKVLVPVKDSKAARKERTKIEAELAKLRKANAELAKEREKLRETTANKISNVAEAAELSSAKAKELQEELADAREKRSAAEKVTEQVQKSMESQSVSLNDKVANLKKSLDAARTEIIAAKAKLDKDGKDILAELEKAKLARKSAEEASSKLESGLSEQKKESGKRVANLEKSLEEAKSIAYRLQEDKTSEIKKFEKALAVEVAERAKQVERTKEIQVGLKKSAMELRTKIESLEDKLQVAEMEASVNRAEIDKSGNKNDERVATLTDKISSLEDQSNSARYEIVTLSSALEIARLKNAELSAKRSGAENATALQMNKMTDTALSLALAEIDALEREYESLDIQADKRQYELLARIDNLEQVTVTSDTNLKDVRQQLELERKLREEMVAQSETRDGMLLDANKLLADTTEKLAQQFHAFQARMHEGTLNDNVIPSADLAPLIGRLEDATSSASIEIKELRKVLAEERQQHAKELLQSKNEIAVLRRKVEGMNQEVSILKSNAAEQEARWLAEMNLKLSEVQVVTDRRIEALTETHKKRVTELGDEVAVLGDKLKASSTVLSKAKQDLVAANSKYTKLVTATGENEEILRKRIHDLELAFALPKTTDTGAVNDPKGGNPELDAKVDDLYQSIVDLSRSNKLLAIKQFESLPAESEKPIVLMKAIANLYRGRKSYEAAYGLYEEILVQDPSNLYAEQKLVMTLFDMGRYDDALARLAKKSEVGEK